MQDTLCKVMEASYSRLKFHESIAANLLKLWSILGCTDVSLEVMLMGNKVQLQRVAYTADEVVTEVDKSMIDSLLAFFSGVTKSNVQDQMDVLRRYALLPASEGKGSIRIHPMVRALCVQTTESPAVDGQLLSIAVTLVATLVKSSGYGQMLHGLAVGLPTYAKAIGNCISRLHFDENLAMDCLTIAEYLEQWEYSSELENLYLYAREALSVRAGSNLNHSTYKLAALYYNQGHIDKAERKLTLLLESVDEADYDTDTLLSCELLGSILAERDEPKKAQHFLERARVGFERTEGPWSSNTLRATRNMGHLALRQGWLRLAEQMFLLAREGPTSPSAMGTPLQSSRLLAASGLVETYVRFGRLELAEQTALSACEEAENLLGPNHASTFARYYTLALVNIYQRKLKQAKESYDKAVEGRNAILSKDHIDIYATFVHIAPGSFLVQGTAPALQYLVYEAFCALYPEHHPGSFVVLTSLAHLCHGQRRLQEADILCGEALRLQIRYLDTSHELVPMTMFCLGIILQDQGKMDQAIRTLICAIQGLERFPVSQRDLLLRAYRALGRACKSSNRSREADEVSRELQQLYDDASPRSLAKQHSLDYWLEALLFSIPMPYGASDNKFLVQAVESDATPQSKQAEGDRLEEASRKVGHRSRMWRKMFGDK
jgi:tetratricopeptide (TPR) repeat protein